MNVVDSRPQDPSIEPEGTKAVAPVILQVLPRLEAGGIERETVDTAAAIAESGWISLVASSGGAMVRELERAGVEHIALPLARGGWWAMRANASKIEKLIRERNVDVVHARSGEASFSARAAAKKTRSGFVTTFHYGVDDESSMFRKRYAAALNDGEKVIAVSGFVAGELVERLGVGRDRIRTVPRGIDLDVFNPGSVSAARMIQLTTEWRLPDAMPVILMPGALLPEKGHDFMIEALARLGRRDVRCIFLGGDRGPQRHRQEIDDHIARTNVGPMVQVVSACRDMPAAYMLADVVVAAPTKPEEFGQIAVEAQAMGRPVIVTDIGGTREPVMSGASGWLIPTGDPDALAAALNEAISMTGGERAQYAARATDHIRSSFSRERMCADVIEIYQDLLRTRPALSA